MWHVTAIQTSHEKLSVGALFWLMTHLSDRPICTEKLLTIISRLMFINNHLPDLRDWASGVSVMLIFLPSISQHHRLYNSLQTAHLMCTRNVQTKEFALEIKGQLFSTMNIVIMMFTNSFSIRSLARLLLWSLVPVFFTTLHSLVLKGGKYLLFLVF